MEEGDKITNKIAEFVKNKRQVLGMSQREFAELVFGDVKKQDWISRIENGRGITVKTVEIIFEKLNCDIDILEN